jgi:hypothetical protein
MIQAIIALAPDIPEVLEIGASMVNIMKTGTVTVEQEAAIRAQLDAVKAKIDAAC